MKVFVKERALGSLKERTPGKGRAKKMEAGSGFRIFEKYSRESRSIPHFGSLMETLGRDPERENESTLNQKQLLRKS